MCPCEFSQGIRGSEAERPQGYELLVFQTINRKILEQILEKSTSKQIWDSTRKKFEGISSVKRSTLQELRKDFEVVHRDESG